MGAARRQTASDHGVRDQRSEEDRIADRRLGDAEGLSSEGAVARLGRYGPNALGEEERSVLLELLSHFWAPIPWMIEVALVLTAVAARWADFGIILALLLLNGLVGFWEEHQAANAIAALKERLAKRARVRRDGGWQVVPAERVVPGDLLAVERGDVIPADGRIAAGSAEADESVLTGESLPVAKREGDDVYSGTVVSRGSPSVRVLATGEATEFGRTAELTAERGPQSHFQAAIFSIGRYLIAIALALVAVIVVVSLLRGDDAATTLEFALVVTIASIPVALPAVLSVTMAVGARSLARHEAVVSHLPAVEEMSGVDVLCADKTGTITRNELAIADVAVVAGGADREEVLREAALTAERDGADPIDAAVLAALGRRPDGCEVLELRAVRRGPQAGRGAGQGAGRRRVPGREGRRAGDPRSGRRLGRGRRAGRRGDRRLRPQGTAGAGGGPRRRRRLAADRRAGDRRPAPRGLAADPRSRRASSGSR